MRTNRTWKFILTDGELDAVFPLQLFSTPCDLGKSSQIMTTGSSHLSSWCFPNPMFKKKSQDIQQDSIWLELSSCQPKLYPGVSCCCWRRTPLCDCRKWRAVKRAQISAERSCSSLKRRRGVKFKFPPWMPKVFFKSSLLQCYITVCGKHRAAVKETQQRRLLQHEASASWIVHISIPYFFSSFAFRNKRTFYTSGNDLYLRLTVSKSHESTKTNRK